MSDEPKLIYLTRWVLNSTGSRILKVRGHPIVGIPGAASIVSGPNKRQVIHDHCFDNEEDARRDAREQIKDSLRTTERELARKKALLEALESDPDFVVDQTEDMQAAE